MWQVSANQLISPRSNFEDDVLAIKEVGFDAVGIWRHKLEEFGIDKGEELLLELGLQVSSLQWAGGFTGGEVLTYRECIDDSIAAIKTAAQLKAPCLIIHPGGRGLHTKNHSKRLVRDALNELIPVARQLGVKLGFELINPNWWRKWTISASPDEAFEFLAEFDPNVVGFVIDSFQICSHPEWSRWMTQAGKQICLVHLADALQLHCIDDDERCLLGDGQLPLDEFISELSEVDYRGFVEIELYGKHLTDYDSRTILAESRRMLAEQAETVRRRF